LEELKADGNEYSEMQEAKPLEKLASLLSL
jgi:hypothetical protein